MSLHPTRWARNLKLQQQKSSENSETCLHPTRWARNLKLQQQKSSENSETCLHPTRWARNSPDLQEIWGGEVLSPSHTVGSEPVLKHYLNIKNKRLHPTRWARNKALKPLLGKFATMSPSHTVGSEPQITTLIKIRHINHFVKGAPFSNEVNFPKSEIMQS